MKSAAIHPFARKMTEICHLLYQNGFAPGKTGNVSALDESLLWVTPTGYGMREITPECWIQIWPNNRVVADEGLTPTSELRMHQAIYKARPDIGAVIHVHPPKATAAAAAHQALDQPILSEIVTTLREVPLLPFYPPGSQALADAAAEQLKTHDAILLANHGVVTIGKTPEEAFANLELVESFAEIYLLANQLGPLKPLTAEQVSSMR